MVWKRWRPVLGLIGCILFVWGAGTDPGKPVLGKPGPVEPVRALLKSVQRLSETKDKAEEGRLSREISGNFDLPEICRACLRGTWDTLSIQERENFTALFRELLEKVAYPKSSDFFKGTKVEVEGVNDQGARVQVDTVVEHPEEGLVEVTFCMADVKGVWLVQDIQLDGVSLVIDLRGQMQKILREQSYEELKRRMREKLESS
jgi:phospholipid transport system substrate-binding protein